MSTILPLLALLSAVPAPAPVKVVTTLTTYAAIAREITGDRATVTSIAQGDENPHYVQPKPSFVPLLSQADLFVTTGLDLELWVPALLDKANNPKVTEGGSGYVAAYTGIDLMDLPTSYSRAGGDIHVFGNPHIWTDPKNAVIIGRNILTGLKRVDPTNAEYFAAREKDFEERMFRALYGDELVKLLGGQALADLDRQGKLFDFLATHKYQGAPLSARLGGWLKEAMPFRDKQMVCYHKEWVYFSREFGIPCVDFIEPKPGIPPTPGHVLEVINEMREKHIPLLFSTSYYPRDQVKEVADRTGAKAVIVPANVGGAPGINTYFHLVEIWIKELNRAFGAPGAGAQ